MREKLREEVIPKSTTKFSSPSPNKEVTILFFLKFLFLSSRIK